MTGDGILLAIVGGVFAYMIVQTISGKRPLVVLLLLCCAVPVSAQDTATEKARALLTLNKLQRERVAKGGCACDVCHCTNCECAYSRCDLCTGSLCEYVLAQARAEAQLKNAWLFIWVGQPDVAVKARFPSAVHVVVPSYGGKTERRLIVPKDGKEYYWDNKSLTPQGVQGFLYPTTSWVAPVSRHTQVFLSTVSTTSTHYAC